jgi:hypothetical protein
MRLCGWHVVHATAVIGYRLLDIRLLQNLAKPRRLELEDPVVRLPALSAWLSQRRQP